MQFATARKEGCHSVSLAFGKRKGCHHLREEEHVAALDQLEMAQSGTHTSAKTSYNCLATKGKS